MNYHIYDKANSTVVQKTVKDEIFLCAQGDQGSAAIILKEDAITPDVIERLYKSVSGNILKVVCSQDHFQTIESALKMITDKIKYVNREGEFDIYFVPAENKLKASKARAISSPVLSTNDKQEEKDVPLSTPNASDEIVEEIQTTVKVLVVDDSTTICNLLKKIMGLSPYIEVVETINDPLDAEAAIKKHNPDVITLDIHMPNLNGVELLKKIYPVHKIPCIMISSISMSEGPLVLDALDAGAVDYIQKPDMSNFAAIANEINTKIISASKVKHQDKKTSHTIASSAHIDINQNLIVIGASTGGTKALKEVFDQLPEEIPPVLVVQHIPAEFSRAFAERLNETAKFTIREAVDGDKVLPNQILVAPGGKQMKFVCRGGKMHVEVNDDAPVNRFKPSVDYLFDSVANSSLTLKVVSAIFTGMGRDGADGMKNLKLKKSATTIAQNEETSVVFGMPKEAIKLGCVDHIIPLGEAANTLMNACFTSEDKKAQ